MEKRAVLAVLLSVGFFVAWNYFVVKTKFKNTSTNQGTLQVDQNDLNVSDDITISDGNGESEYKPVLKEDVVKTELPVKANQFTSFFKSEVKEKDIHINTNLADIVITSKGAVIKSIKLKKHLNDKKGPLEIIASNKKALPLSLDFENSDLSVAVNNVNFTASANDLVVDEMNSSKTLSLKFVSKEGFSIIKALTFYHDKYLIDIKTELKGFDRFNGISSYSVVWPNGIGSGSVEKSARFTFDGATTFLDEDVIVDKEDDMEGPVTHTDKVKWTAIQNKFFAAILIPKGENVSAVITKAGKKKVDIGLKYPVNAGVVENSLSLFVGPKEFDRIRSYNLKFEKLIDFGMVGNTFKFLVNPIFTTLKFIYKLSHNYGISIIILTILIKILFLPLSHKSYKSMERTKQLQPQLKLMQERYKDDKTRLNEEMMKFYKENKINPLGGCLPMLVQIPVFFALYNVLFHSVELRHAPFIFWITDLSVKDPYYILPILMGLSMLVQQRMSPTTGDPIQAKMMMLMPVIFTVMFLGFPVGLVIYWLINNLMTIGQQYMISKKS